MDTITYPIVLERIKCKLTDCLDFFVQHSENEDPVWEYFSENLGQSFNAKITYELNKVMVRRSQRSGNNALDDAILLSDQESQNEPIGRQFEVERVVDRRIRQDCLEYKLKWIGWDSEANTWESIADCINAYQRIIAFENGRDLTASIGRSLGQLPAIPEFLDPSPSPSPAHSPSLPTNSNHLLPASPPPKKRNENLDKIVENKMCSICLEPYTSPILLKCAHSFCHKCSIREFKARYSFKDRSFPCPLCKERFHSYKRLYESGKCWNDLTSIETSFTKCFQRQVFQDVDEVANDDAANDEAARQRLVGWNIPGNQRFSPPSFKSIARSKPRLFKKLLAKKQSSPDQLKETKPPVQYHFLRYVSRRKALDDLRKCDLTFKTNVFDRKPNQFGEQTYRLIRSEFNCGSRKRQYQRYFKLKGKEYDKAVECKANAKMHYENGQFLVHLNLNHSHEWFI